VSNRNRRSPAVAGVFYPSKKDELYHLLELSFKDKRFGPGEIPPDKSQSSTKKIFGIVSPHAGYIYSGSVAANAYYKISTNRFNSVIMIGPNHYGIGPGLATLKDGEWETPLGFVGVDSDLANGISEDVEALDFDELAHSRDHCLEVQLPFLQYIKTTQFKITPIIMIMQDIETALKLGNSIARVTRTRNNEVVLIASSDFTHYESNEDAHRKDSQLIDSILSLDISAFYDTLERLNVTACGFGAIAAVMTAVKALGATRGRLLKYATSGDVRGDKTSVVGYASIIFI
jgi:MEMO1 family protein